MSLFTISRCAKKRFTYGLVLCISFMATPVLATKLEISADSPAWAHFGASLLLYSHIVGGGLGIIAGTIAILTRKGQNAHRIAGRVFFVSMFIAYAIGAGVAPFLEDGQRPNFVAGILALYLLVTAWLAARRRDPVVGIIEYAGICIALFVVASGLLFMWQAANNPSGSVDGSPPQAFVLFVVVGLVALFDDFIVIMRGKINGRSRISRHLWRMCMSMFIAGGAFFFGQEQALPDAIVGSIWQMGLAFYPLLAMVIWLALPRLKNGTDPAD